jgi:hypothetical protein
VLELCLAGWRTGTGEPPTDERRMIMIKQRGVVVAALALAAVASACATHIAVDKTRPQYFFAPTCAAGVAVYDNFGQVPGPYYELSFITAKGNVVWTTDSALVLRMREEAAEVGASGIVANTDVSATTAQILGAALGTGDADRRGRAIAVRVPGDMARVNAACGTMS